MTIRLVEPSPEKHRTPPAAARDSPERVLLRWRFRLRDAQCGNRCRCRTRESTLRMPPFALGCCASGLCG